MKIKRINNYFGDDSDNFCGVTDPYPIMEYLTIANVSANKITNPQLIAIDNIIYLFDNSNICNIFELNI